MLSSTCCYNLIPYRTLLLPRRHGAQFHTKSTARSLFPRPSRPPVHRPLKQFQPPQFAAVDGNAYTKILDSCIRFKLLEDGKEIHRRIISHRYFAGNYPLLEKIVQMYISCGEIESARLAFDDLPQPSVFLWNAMIRAYAWNGPFGRAVELYQRMLDTGIEPNKFTFPFVLKACSALEALTDGILIHEHAKKAGLELDVFVSTALLDMYLKCGCLDDAHEVFCRMPQKDVVAWNALVSSYALNGRYQEAVRCLLQMQRTGNIPNPSTIVALLPIVGQAKALIQGKSIHAFCIRRRIDKGDVLVNTALLDMYGKSECLVCARRIFDSMSFRNEVTWSEMIGCYTLCGRMAEALQIFSGSSGIGAETARVMALRGAHVIIGARNMEAANVVKENIQQSIPSAKVDVSKLELSLQKSARAFADRFIERNLPLNILINNASVMNCPYKLSEDGIEMQFATNHLGHFLLTNLLLEKMKNIAKESGIEGRIVNLSSVAHIGI